MTPSEYGKIWREHNKERIVKKKHEYYQANKVKIKAAIREYKIRKRLRLIKLFGGKCICCGYDNVLALDFDHIHNDGKPWNRYWRGKIIHEVAKHPDRFQLLCRNCNWIKELEYRHAKHVKETTQLYGSDSTLS